MHTLFYWQWCDVSRMYRRMRVLRLQCLTNSCCYLYRNYVEPHFTSNTWHWKLLGRVIVYKAKKVELQYEREPTSHLRSKYFDLTLDAPIGFPIPKWLCQNTIKAEKMDTRLNLKLQLQNPKVILPPRVSVRKSPKSPGSEQKARALATVSPIVLSNIKTSNMNKQKRRHLPNRKISKKKSLCLYLLLSFV